MSYKTLEKSSGEVVTTDAISAVVTNFDFTQSPYIDFVASIDLNITGKDTMTNNIYFLKSNFLVKGDGNSVLTLYEADASSTIYDPVLSGCEITTSVEGGVLNITATGVVGYQIDWWGEITIHIN